MQQIPTALQQSPHKTLILQNIPSSVLEDDGKDRRMRYKNECYLGDLAAPQHVASYVRTALTVHAHTSVPTSQVYLYKM